MSASPSLLTTLALASLVIAGGPAGAQIFTGIEPRQPLMIPQAGIPQVGGPGAAGPAPVRHVAPPAAPDTTEPAAALVSVRAPEVLRHLPSTLEGLRMTGEAANLQWPVYLTRQQAESGLRFRLAYRSAVSVLDEASSLTLVVNGRSVGAVAVNAPQATRSVEFAIPAGLAVAGYNAVSLGLQERHRVDCSVPATYELWTKISPAQTGFVLDPAAGGTSALADLPALLPNADGTLPIRIVLAGKANPAQIDRLIAATQRIAIAGRFLQPTVDFGPLADDGHGLNLVVGRRDTLRAVASIAGEIGEAGPLAKFVKLGTSPRPTLLLVGSTDAEVDAAIAAVGMSEAPLGSPAGLRAAANYPGLATPGGTTLHLKDFGIENTEFSGRFLRESVNLVLPADFLSADYARGTFDLAGGYAAGLMRDAQVRVDVNGRNAGQVKLAAGDGDVFRHNELFLPLSLMHPGLNRIDILAETPKPDDATCDTSKPSTTDKRFLLLDATELKLPTLARVQRLPDLGATAAGAVPFLTGQPRLFVPKPSRDVVAAALSIVARLGVSAGQVLPFGFMVTAPTDDAGATLIVAPAQALDSAVMTEIGLDPAAVEAAWRDRVTPETGADASVSRPAVPRWWGSGGDGPAACSLARPSAGLEADAASAPAAPAAAAPAPTAVAGTPDDDLFERWTAHVHGPASWRERVANALTGTQAWVARQSLAISWPRSPKTGGSGIGRAASLIVAQGYKGGSDHVTTIVTAPDATTLKAATSCLGDPQVWSKMAGRLSVLDAATGAVTTTATERFHYAVSGPLSVGNLRLVMAGWLSLNPLAFVLAVVLVALCLSGTTLVFVRGVGRKGS